MLPDKVVEIGEIYSLLFRLGITSNYTGFAQAAYAIHLAAQQPDCLLMVTKWLYPEIAKHCETSICAVERNIRTVVSVAWEKNHELLEELACRNLRKKPTTTQFISILARHFVL